MSFVKNLFSTPKVPTPTPAPTPAPAPTVDTAREKAQSEQEIARRRGRLSTVLTPSNTGAELGGTPAPSLKRVLGG